MEKFLDLINSITFLSKIVKYLGEKKLANNFFTKFADNGFV